MQPVKLSGSAAYFPVFRGRIRDNLEDGLLSDAQKIEFLPKFVTDEAYDVVARSAECSYEDIVANLEDRCGNQLQLRLPALKSWQWDRNWEIEIL